MGGLVRFRSPLFFWTLVFGLVYFSNLISQGAMSYLVAVAMPLAGMCIVENTANGPIHLMQCNGEWKGGGGRIKTAYY